MSISSVVRLPAARTVLSALPHVAGGAWELRTISYHRAMAPTQMKRRWVHDRSQHAPTPARVPQMWPSIY